MKAERLLSLFAPLLTLALFAPVGGFEYVWDDVFLFVDSDTLRDWDKALKAMFEPLLPGSGYLRPLGLLTFALEFRWLGQDPGVSHLINLALHIGNVVLVGALAHRLLQSTDFPPGARNARALVAGLFYGLHPAMIEPVSWVSSRFDLLCCGFILLALAAESRVRAGGWRCLLISLCFFFAALSKEMAATFPALLLLFQTLTRWRGLPWREIPSQAVKTGEWAVYACTLLAGLAYLGLRWHFGFGAASSDLVASGQLAAQPWLHTAYVALSFQFYLHTALWPFADLSVLHPVHIPSITFGEGAWAFAALWACAALLIVGLRQRSPSLTLLAAAAVALLPVLNLIPLKIVGTIGHERFLVLPLAFLALAFALLPSPDTWFQSRLKLLPTVSRLFGALWILAAAATVRTSLPLWSSDLALWGWAYQKHPHHWLAQQNYLSALLVRNRTAEAQKIFDELLARGPLDMYVQVLYGNYLTASKQPTEAINYLQGVLDIFPPYDQLSAEQIETIPMALHAIGFAYRSLSQAHRDLGEYDKALASAEEAMKYDPKNPMASLLKSMALYGLDRASEARIAYETSLAGYAPDERPRIQTMHDDFLSYLCDPARQKHKTTCLKIAAPAAAPASAKPRD